MKRFSVYLSLLFVFGVAIAMVFDFVNVALIRVSTGATAYKIAHLFENSDSNEVAIVGSSRACGHFIPSIISTNCFNYGISSMGVYEMMSLLNVLKRRGGLTPIICNLDPWGSFQRGQVADYRLVPKNGPVSTGRRIWGVRFWGSFYSNIEDFLNARYSITRLIDHGAKVQLNCRSREEWGAINARIKSETFLSDKDGENRFLALLGEFSPRKLYVVISPCSSRWNSLFKGREGLMKWIRRLQDVKNVRVINYFDSMEFSDDDFADPTHLNLQGAKKLSTYVSRALEIDFQRKLISR